MNKFRVFFKEYFDELLYKVQWPNLDDLQSSTVTVLIASLLIAAVIALYDTVWRFAVGGLYSLFDGLL